MATAVIIWDKFTQRQVEELGEFDNWNEAYKHIVSIFVRMDPSLDPVALISENGREGYIYRNGTIVKCGM